MSNSQSLGEQAKAALNTLAKTDKNSAMVVGSYLKSLREQNTAALGNDEVFVLRDESGRITATKQMVHLSVADGTLIQPVFNGPFTISAFGYSRLAEAAGATVMNAPTVVVDGVEQANPYCRRDDQGNVIAVHCRAIAFRYGKGGNPVVSDRTVIFDLETYLRADMIGKAKQAKYKDAFRLGLKGVKPEDNGLWAEYNIDSAVSLWMNVQHEEATKFLGQTLNRQKKPTEFAQTFSQRNALKHLFGIDKTPEGGKWNAWSVEVIAYRPEHGGIVSFNKAQFESSVNNVTALAAGEMPQLPEVQTQGMTIDLKSSGTDVIESEADLLDGADVEDEAAAYNLDSDDSGSAMEQMDPIPDQENEKPEPHELDPETEKAWENLQITKENMDAEYAEFAQQSAIEECPENAAKIMSDFNRFMDMKAENQE